MANNLDIKRAEYAFDEIEKIQGKKVDFKKSFKSYVKNVPMLIKTNGLASTFAFVKSKGKEEYDLIYKIVNIWLRSKMDNPIFKTENDENANSLELSKALLELSVYDYKRTTKEVIALFVWLKRFADGQLETDDSIKTQENV